MNHEKLDQLANRLRHKPFPIEAKTFTRWLMQTFEWSTSLSDYTGPRLIEDLEPRDREYLSWFADFVEALSPARLAPPLFELLGSDPHKLRYLLEMCVPSSVADDLDIPYEERRVWRESLDALWSEFTHGFWIKGAVQCQ